MSKHELLDGTFTLKAVFALYLILFFTESAFSIDGTSSLSSEALPTTEEANRYAGSWDQARCGTEEEFAEKLNHLLDAALCRKANSFSECSTLMGGEALGSIAAVRAARTSAALSTDRPKLCYVGAQLERGFVPYWLELIDGLLMPSIFARENACIKTSEMASYRTKGYLRNGETHLRKVIASESAALKNLLSSSGVSNNVFSSPPATEDAFRNYAREMMAEIGEFNSVAKASAQEFVDAVVEDFAANDVKPASAWQNLRQGLQGRMGDVAFQLEEQAGKRYAARSGMGSQFSEIVDLLNSNGTKLNPGLTPSQRTRVEEFRKMNPQLSVALDEALESRLARATAQNALTKYQSLLRDLDRASTRAQFTQSPESLRARLADLPHFDFKGANSQRTLVSAAFDKVSEVGPKGRIRKAGLGISPTEWRGKRIGPMGAGRKALVNTGSRLATRGVGAVAGAAALSIGGGMAMAAEAAASGKKAACGHVVSQFSPKDDEGCEAQGNLDTKEVMQYLSLPTDLAMREAADHPEICDNINSLIKKYGPANFTASCHGNSGFSLTSRGGRGARSLQLKATFGQQPGQIAELNISGSKAMEQGGMIGLRFQNEKLSEARFPKVDGPWEQGMQDDSQRTLEFNKEGTYDVLSADQVKREDSPLASHGKAALSFVDDMRSVVAEVSNCCTGAFGASAERCKEYGIERTGSQKRTQSAQ